MDGQHFMDVLVGNPILCIGLATVLYWLWVSYANNAVTRKVRKESNAGGTNDNLQQLKAFPTVGSSLPILSLIDAFKFIPNGGDILDAGVRKVRISNYCQLAVTIYTPHIFSGLVAYSKYRPQSVGGSF